MATFLLSNNPQLTIRAAMALKAQGIAVQPFQAASEVSAATRDGFPEALLVDLSEKRRERIRLLGEVRRSYPAAQIPLVVFHPADTERPAATFKPLSIDIEYTLPDIPPTLSMTIKDLVERHLQDRPEGQAHPYALEILARVWRQGLSGTLALGRQKVTLCEGGLVNPHHLPILERGLLRGGFRFTPDTVSALGDWYSVGMALWGAARTRAADDFFPRHQRHILRARPNSARAESLPLSEATRQLLSDRRKELPLRRHLSALKLDPAVVSQDLCVLYLLGLYRLEPGRARSSATRSSHLKGLPPPRTVPSSSHSSAIAQRPVDKRVKNRLLLKRLRREVETLATADEWTILGLQPTDDSARIAQAGERMQSRYQKMAAETSIAEARELAGVLAERAAEARRFLDVLVGVFQTYGAPTDPHCREEVAFRKGLALLESDAGMSMRLFSAACDERMQSPRNLAYLGWATHLHKGLAAHEEALELLQLSESLNGKAATTQVFLAGVEHGAGEHEQAEERLARLIRRGDAPEAAHTLYRQVKQKRRQ